MPACAAVGGSLRAGHHLTTPPSSAPPSAPSPTAAHRHRGLHRDPSGSSSSPEPRRAGSGALAGARWRRRHRAVPLWLPSSSTTAAGLSQATRAAGPGSYHTHGDCGPANAPPAASDLDGFVPLGSYGYGTCEEYARNGVNSYANFAKTSERPRCYGAFGHARGQHDGRRDIESRDRAPGCALHHDEPDCSDYNFDEFPPPAIGQMAMEMEKRVDYAPPRPAAPTSSPSTSPTSPRTTHLRPHRRHHQPGLLSAGHRSAVHADPRGRGDPGYGPTRPVTFLLQHSGGDRDRRSLRRCASRAYFSKSA